MSIGYRIKMLRTHLGLSIDELADKLGKNRTTVYRYENGDIENLPLCILDSLAEALDTTPAYLMGWETSNNIEQYTHDIIENRYALSWINEVGANSLNEEECKKVMEYAKFLLSMRDK